MALRSSCTRHICMLIALAGVLVAGCQGFAQTITGTVRGSVTDPSGAVVSGATVTATNAGTGVTTSSVTNHDGLYNIQFLPIGQYTITVAMPGFRSL